MTDPLASRYRTYRHADHRGKTYLVHTRGSGPPVVIIHELAGISPLLHDFADRVVRAGFAVHLPELVTRRGGPARLAIASVQVCISAEFVKLAREKTSPVVTWLRSLALKLYEDTSQPVGVVGMCLTGGFALAMAVDSHVRGPVMAHPSLPLAIGSRRQRDLGLDPEDLVALQARKDLRILGVRFSSDLMAPGPRFSRMEDEFPGRFTSIELQSGCRSPLGFPPWEHSVLNNGRLRSDRPKDAVARAELERVVDEVLVFLGSELGPASSPSPPGIGTLPG